MKLFKALICSLVVTLLVSVTSITAFASPNDDVIQALRNANVEEVYIIKAENYLKTTTLTATQANTIIAQINKVVDIMNKENVTNPKNLSSTSKEEVINAITAAANAVNLKVSISQDAAGNWVLSLLDQNGNVVISSTANEIVMKKTGSNNIILALGLGILVASAGSFIYIKKIKSIA